MVVKDNACDGGDVVKDGGNDGGCGSLECLCVAIYDTFSMG